MDWYRGVIVLVFMAILWGWGGVDEVRAQAHPTAEQIKKQLMPSAPVRSPAAADIKRMGVRGVREAERDKETTIRSPEINLNIPFEKNSARISSEAQPVLRELGEALSSKELKGNIFEIQGHTCDLGDPQDNSTLSKQRAEVVKRYLVKQFGLDPDQLLPQGFGENKPLAKNDNEEGRRQNRRVTVVNTMQPFAGGKARPVVEVQAFMRRANAERPMKSGMVLRENDDYALSFKASQSCYVYVYQKDARGKWQQLFPSSSESLDISSQRNPVQPEIAYRLPESKNRWLCLDENRGTEHLVVIAYPNEIPKPDQVCQAILNGRLDQQVAKTMVSEEPEKESGGIRQMGVKGTREGHAYQPHRQSRPTPQIQDVESHKLFQWQFSFEHQ